MTRLTQQEQNFYNDLINDEIENKDLSILNVFFFGGIVNKELAETAILEDFQNRYADFFKNSIFLFSAEKSSVIGKYKEYFWYSNEDGYISFVDTSLPNFLYFIMESHIVPMTDDDFKEDLEDMFESSNLKLEDYISKYKYICEKNGYSFDMKWEYDEEKSKEFDRIIEKLK